MTNRKEHQQTEGKKTKGRKGRMYVQQRNISLVGLHDLPEHMKGGDSPAQLTPIYSILLSDIEVAFLAQIKGETNNYINMLTLKPKFTSSKLEVRKTTSVGDFGWIDDIELLKQLPTEFAVLEKELEKRFNKFKEVAAQRSLEKIEKDAALLSALGLANKVPESTKKLIAESKGKLGI
ncbi:hypothetical protein [Vibrio hepatarius]|uniref:hypothetical protein n=1 Tax=Vibrio hepatarius TaxID=171383 RepID=UPI001C0A664E|nr:hypothetical protein [Vibrio hepatarius]MBU2898334.1 hypothetical protein [Vibrio hepatarius]